MFFSMPSDVTKKANVLFFFGGNLAVIEQAELYVALRTSMKESVKSGYRRTLNYYKVTMNAYTLLDLEDEMR